MTSKSQEPLTRPDKPVVINSDVKAFEALYGPVLRDWPSYHIHDLIAWYAWHAPADGVRGREVRGQTARQPAGHYGKLLNWANALEQPPARLRGGCARVRKPRPGARLHGKAQSGQRASLTERLRPDRGTMRLPVVG